jgi:outer membrane protein OmpA-like peptidoglycan-associated protein
VSIYSNIVILGTSSLFAGDLSLTQAVCSMVSPKSQAACLGMSRPTVVSSTLFLSRQEPNSRLEQSQTFRSVDQSPAVSIADPPFLRHPILFDRNSLQPNLAARNMLKSAATWLREHREARVLIVGSCDSSGSETCTHALAEGRGAAIQKFLQNSGIAHEQLVGVKGWDNLDRTCGSGDVKCQQSNRSVRIFMASSATPGEKP